MVSLRKEYNSFIDFATDWDEKHKKDQMKKLFSIIVFSWMLSVCNTAEISTPGDRMFTKYFESETKRISKKTLSEIETIEDWNSLFK